MLIFDKSGQTEKSSRATINDRLSVNSRVFGTYAEYKENEDAIRILKKASDFTEDDELKITVLQKIAEAFGATVKELEKRVLVISPVSAKDVAELFSAN